MRDKQQYQINFSVSESLGSKTMSFYKFAPNEDVVIKEIITNCGTSAKISNIFFAI